MNSLGPSLNYEFFELLIRLIGGDLAPPSSQLFHQYQLYLLLQDIFVQNCVVYLTIVHLLINKHLLQLYIPCIALGIIFTTFS
jgi:hypothetical protein